MVEYNPEYMNRAITLAKKADAGVQPNPYVGAVVVQNDKIIGEGYHKKFGEKHAEPIAIDNSTESTEGADLYVTLEPCSHNGKTPPCVDKIIESKIRRVFIGMVDPYEKVSGRGIKILQNAGIKVVTGIKEKEVKELNKVFITNIYEKRPFIYIKYAMTLDGYIATTSYNSKWISNELSRENVHHKRHNVQGILVGSNTVVKDNPRLTARLKDDGFQPTPVVLDFSGDISSLKYKIFNRKSILITSNFNLKSNNNVKIFKIKKDESIEINNLGKLLCNENIHSVLVEGGAKTISYFLKNKFFDEINVYVSSKIIGRGLSPTAFGKVDEIKNGIELQKVEHFSFGDNIMIKGARKSVHWID